MTIIGIVTSDYLFIIMGFGTAIGKSIIVASLLINRNLKADIKSSVSFFADNMKLLANFSNNILEWSTT